MARRLTIFQQITDLIGDPPLHVLEPGDGWPGLVNVATGSGTIPVAMHVSTVSTHARAAYERRFQNPGSNRPVAAPAGFKPVLVGLGSAGVRPILVALDGSSRLGRARRFSILFHEQLLQSAATNGWAEYESNTGEVIFAMLPRLFPAFVEAFARGVSLDPLEVAVATTASGVVDDATQEAAERARVAVSRLVRSASFSKEVRKAYGGCCAMCGLGIGLVQGAHIFPASAPGSPDKVWNGMALCHNHHAAFDKHYIWVDPRNLTVKMRPDILALAKTDEAVEIFHRTTDGQLTVPTSVRLRPRPDMFIERYKYFDPAAYSWV